MFGMKKWVFCSLVRDLCASGKLSNSRYVSAEEKVAIFLRIAVSAGSNREIQERFMCGGATISMYVCNSQFTKAHAFLDISMRFWMPLLVVSTLNGSSFLQVMCLLRYSATQSSSHTLRTVLVQLMVLISMLRSLLMPWHDSETGKDGSHRMCWLPVFFLFCSAISSVDGREVQVMVVSLKMLEKHHFAYPMESTCLQMLAFLLVMLFLFLTEVCAII